MKAMILAAGRGERLRPYTDHCPKPLLEVNGKALIEYHLDAIAKTGITQVVINTSWLAEMIEERLGSGEGYGLNITYSQENRALETAGGIVQALPHLGDRFIVINADVFTDYPFEKLLAIKDKTHLVLVENPEHNPEGDFTLCEGVIGNQLQSRHTFAGIAVYQAKFFEGLSAGKQALAPLLREAADKSQISGELYSGSWTDVGTIERWRSLY